MAKKVKPRSRNSIGRSQKYRSRSTPSLQATASRQLAWAKKQLAAAHAALRKAQRELDCAQRVMKRLE